MFYNCHFLLLIFIAFNSIELLNPNFAFTKIPFRFHKFLLHELTIELVPSFARLMKLPITRELSSRIG